MESTLTIAKLGDFCSGSQNWIIFLICRRHKHKKAFRRVTVFISAQPPPTPPLLKKENKHPPNFVVAPLQYANTCRHLFNGFCIHRRRRVARGAYFFYHKRISRSFPCKRRSQCPNLLELLIPPMYSMFEWITKLPFFGCRVHDSESQRRNKKKRCHRFLLLASTTSLKKMKSSRSWTGPTELRLSPTWD